MKVVCLVVFVFSMLAWSDGALAKDELVHLDFDGAELREIIPVISELTGKRFVYGDEVKGKITIVSPSPMTREEAFAVFVAALEANKFSVVKKGAVYQIVPLRNIKSEPIPTDN